MADNDTLQPSSFGSTPMPQDNTLSQVLQTPSAEVAAPSVQSPSAPQPSALNAAVQQPTDLPRFQRTFGGTLKGLLMGFGLGGVPGAIAGAANPTGAAREIGIRQQEEQSRVKFLNAQSAALVAQAAMDDKRLQNFDEDHRMAILKDNTAIFDDLVRSGFMPVATTALDQGEQANSASATSNLQNLTGQLGSVPPLLTLHLGGQAVSFNLNQIAPTQAMLQTVNNVRNLQGLPPIDMRVWQGMDQTVRNQMANDAVKFDVPIPSEQNLTLYKNYLANLKNQPDTASKAANVQKVQGIVDQMTSILDQENQRKNAQTAAQKGAESQAELPYQERLASYNESLKKTQAQFEQDLKQGNSDDAGRLLANRDITLSELKSRGLTPQFIISSVQSAKKFDPNYNPQVAEAQYNYAHSTATQNVLNMISAMQEQGGSLDIATKAFNSIPLKIPVESFNKIVNGTLTKFGGKSIVQFRTAVLGLADEYSKVMGGGQPSDTGRQQALDIIKEAYSKGQGAAATDILKQDIQARKRGIVRDNPILQRMYPDEQTAAGTNNAPFDPSKEFHPTQQ